MRVHRPIRVRHVRRAEAVDRDEQERITLAAHRAARDEHVARWRETRADVEQRLDWLYSQRFDRDVTTQLRAVRRPLDRIDQRIAG